MKKVLLAVIAIALLVIAGCSKPPEAEMAAAQSAINNAKAAEAEQYAPQAFRMLSDSLNGANAMKTEQDNKFALFRSYGDSKAMFERVATMSTDVINQANAEKERVKQEVTGMMAETKTLLDSAMVLLDKAPQGKDNKAELELIKNDLTNIGSEWMVAEGDFNGGKYLVARTKLESIKSRIASITAEICKAYEAKGKKCM
ncbi:MAG: DUF4398 domain-containing protein [bacterium]|nr:DUF4398 domain-containing protein [bacterium]